MARLSGWAAIAAVALMAVTGALMSLRITEHNVGMTPDGIAYAGAAHNIAAGKGVTTPFTFYTGRYTPDQQYAYGDQVPFTHFPPLYPAVLAALSKTGASVVQAARWLQAILLALNLALVGALAARLTDRRAIGAVVAPMAFLIVSSSVAGGWLLESTFVASESLMTAAFLVGLLLLSSLWDRWSSARFLALLAVVAAATATRFAGMAFGITATIAILIWAPVPRARRARDAALVFAATVLPFVVQSLWWSAVGAEGARPVFFDPPSGFRRSVEDVIASWFLPRGWRREPLAGFVELTILAVLVVVAVLASRTAPPSELERGNRRILLRLLGVLAVVYTVTVYGSRSVLDASIPIDARILRPLLPLTVLAVVACLYRVARLRLPVWAAGATLTVVGAIAVLPHISGTVKLEQRPYRPVTDTQIRRFLKGSLPRNALVASNSPEAVWGWTGHSAMLVPPVRYPETNRANPRWLCETLQLRDLLDAHDGFVVLGRGLLGSAPRALVLRVIPMTLERSFGGLGVWRVVPPAGDAPGPRRC